MYSDHCDRSKLTHYQEQHSRVDYVLAISLSICRIARTLYLQNESVFSERILRARFDLQRRDKSAAFRNAGKPTSDSCFIRSNQIVSTIFRSI